MNIKFNPPPALVQAVLTFRSAIERYAPASRFLKSFPDETCQHVSRLLARYLAEQGWGKADMVVNAIRRAPEGVVQSHAWLSLRGILIDITGDQFPEQADKVVVRARSVFHESFAGSNTLPYDKAMKVTHEWEARYDDAYREILQIINEGCSGDQLMSAG
jgi:hypothetical protein